MKVTLIRPRLLICKKNFTWRATRYWNRLPQSLRDIKEQHIFKKQLKKHILDKRDQTQDSTQLPSQPPGPLRPPGPPPPPPTTTPDSNPTQGPTPVPISTPIPTHNSPTSPPGHLLTTTTTENNTCPPTTTPVSHTCPPSTTPVSHICPPTNNTCQHNKPQHLSPPAHPPTPTTPANNTCPPADTNKVHLLLHLSPPTTTTITFCLLVWTQCGQLPLHIFSCPPPRPPVLTVKLKLTAPKKAFIVKVAVFMDLMLY